MVEETLLCNQVPIFYRKAGDGKPVVFLHGNGEDGRLFLKISDRLAGEGLSVYLIDSRGHGKSGKAPLGYADMVADVRAFIENLGLIKPALYGFSDGGIVGLILAHQNPGLLSRLAVSGVNLNPRALKRGFRAAVKLAHFFTRDEKLKLMLREPDITAEELARIAEPLLVLAGAKDIIPDSHTREIAAAVAGAKARILAGESHDSYVADNDKLYACIAAFLRADGDDGNA